MIRRPEKLKQLEDEAIQPGATKDVTVVDFIFSFGPGDTLDYTLGPGDAFAEDSEYFRLTFSDGERVVIDKYKVRFWSHSSRKVTVPALSV